MSRAQKAGRFRRDQSFQMEPPNQSTLDQFMVQYFHLNAPQEYREPEGSVVLQPCKQKHQWNPTREHVEYEASQVT